MRHLLLLTCICLVTMGCSKKPPVAEPEPHTQANDKTPPADTTAKDRAYWFTALKGSNPKARQDATQELAVWVETDPESITSLLELLKDRTTAGLGKTHPTRISSTREAAAITLAHGGPKGEAALREKGLPALREGLTDSDAAIREHTVYTVGLLGSLARPLSPEVMKLCTDSNADVRGRAFDALREVGITDPVGLAALLANEQRDVVTLAAELIVGLSEIPEGAVPHLMTALGDESSVVRTAAASALATAGKAAAPAAEALAKAAREAYPEEFDATQPFQIGSEAAYWRALVAIGSPAVAPTAELLTHPNPMARTFAARTLGDIGPSAKAATGKLQTALKDSFGSVAIDAACALIRIGEAKDDATELIRRAIDSPNSVASYAIESLPRMGDAAKPLIPLALAKLESPNPYARLAAIELVGTLEPTEAKKHAAELGRLASDPEQIIRYRAGCVLESLGAMGSPAAEALGKALASEKEARVRDQFVSALAAMGPGAKPALAELLTLAREPNLQLEERRLLFRALVTADPRSKEVAALLLGEMVNPEVDTRIVVASAMAKLVPIPGEGLKKLVAMANTDRNTAGRIAALRALATAGPQAATARADLEAIAGGKYPEFALLAKVALAASSGDVRKAAADVRTGLTDRNTQVRQAAVESLPLVGPIMADLPALQKMLRDPGDNTREAAAISVGAIGRDAKEAVPNLIRLLDDRNGSVRAAAATALGEMGTAALPAIEKLKELRGDARLSDAQAGPAARKALEKLGVKEKQQ